MVNIRQFVLSLITFPFLRSPFQQQETQSKSIAIVGSGSAGLAILKTLLDLPEDTRRNWEIVLYEQRRNVGGIWLPDAKPKPAEPQPELPESPLYPLLHTNTPTPSMTYPGFPFPPNTPLYPSHEYVQRYHYDYANSFNLLPHIRFNHTVTRSSWVGNSTIGRWNITVQDHRQELFYKPFDHLIVASGHNHEPRIPTFLGQDSWLAHNPKREIIHSIWYNGPEKYVNRSVLVVGAGASGMDVAVQIAPIAGRIYQSVRHDYTPPTNSIILKPEISHFTRDAVVFSDGSSLSDVDSIMLGTGYDLRLPFLEDGDAVLLDPMADSNHSHTQGLVTNLRYLRPLHQHVVSLCPSYPLNALTFIGLPIAIANCPSDIAQSLYVAQLIVNPSLFPSREELFGELIQHEEWLRTNGWDPYRVGHFLVNDSRFDYQDEIIRNLKERGAIPDDGKEFVEPWRREENVYLKRAWTRVEQLGTQIDWLEGVETEEEWADLMQRLNEWERNWEEGL